MRYSQKHVHAICRAKFSNLVAQTIILIYVYDAAIYALCVSMHAQLTLRDDVEEISHICVCMTSIHRVTSFNYQCIELCRMCSFHST